MKGELALAAGFAAGLLALALGPRNSRLAQEAAHAFDAPPDDPAALPGFVAARESAWPDIVPGAAKRVVLADGGVRRTAWAVVYVHGFSATRQEIAPVCERVAQALSANLFETRLAGHGRGPAAMAQASIGAWKADLLEALAIGRRLGRRVLVIAASTGASLAAWLAVRPESAADVAWVLVSPNFALREPAAWIADLPWGRQLVRWHLGPERVSTPRNDGHSRWWNTRYPTEALFPMLAAVRLAGRQPLQRWRTPVLVLMSPADRVVDPQATRRAFDRIGSADKRLVEVTDAADPGQHIIAGDVFSPGTTASVVATITDWIGPRSP